jgi:hypothetical protein
MTWSAILLGLFFLLVAIAKRWTNRQLAVEQARLHRYSQWACPACRETYGDAVQYVRYANDHAIGLGRKEFVRHAILICPYCKQVTCFDPQGHHHPALCGSIDTEVAEQIVVPDRRNV